MNKQEKLAALDGVDIDSLHGSTKSKKIAKLFVQGMAYKEIAKIFGLSVTRIAQVTDKQARIAKFYKDRQKDTAFQELVVFYMEKLSRNEAITISSDVDVSRHLSAVSEAEKQVKVD